MSVHLVFDLIAAAASVALTVAVYHWRLRERTEGAFARAGAGYGAALVAGAVIGGYGLGTLNLVLTGVPGVGRSILGALAGAIAGVELYKTRAGIRGSTGIIFVAGFSASLAVGRIGCFLSGLADQTHGVPTTLPWGHDFGDGIARHPVQLYEAGAMALFLAVALAALARRSPFFLRYGFYLCAGFYAAQRFLWEFLKPYGTVLGPMNLFHFTALAVLAYATIMIARGREAVRDA